MVEIDFYFLKNIFSLMIFWLLKYKLLIISLLIFVMHQVAFSVSAEYLALGFLSFTTNENIV
ncbi:hypothetical protein VK87_0200145 [Escherichia fergusonii]|nr:hypothetical protein VK87_0200145 [Escherichia fergusonii]